MAAVPGRSAGDTFDVKPEFPFGLAPLKQEGATIAYDQGDRMARALAQSIMQTKERVAADVLGRMFSDEDTREADGLSEIIGGLGESA